MVRFDRLAPLAAAAFLISATPAAAVVLSAPLNGTNGQSGIMFDLVATNALTVASGAVSLDPGSYTLEVYTRLGTVVGNLTAAGWTLISTINNVIGTGNGTQTAFDFADFAMGAGATTGIYITTTATVGMNYSDGTAVGNVVASDANLAILSGYGRAYAFAGAFSPRNFNGSFTYALGATNPVPEPASWALLMAGFGMAGAVARRRRGKARSVTA